MPIRTGILFLTRNAAKDFKINHLLQKLFYKRHKKLLEQAPDITWKDKLKYFDIQKVINHKYYGL